MAPTTPQQPAVDVGPHENEKMHFFHGNGTLITQIKVVRVHGMEVVPPVKEDALLRECVLVIEALRAKCLCCIQPIREQESGLANM